MNSEDPRESKTARLPGWEEENEPGSDRLFDQSLIECIKRIAKTVEWVRARHHD